MIGGANRLRTARSDALAATSPTVRSGVVSNTFREVGQGEYCVCDDRGVMLTATLGSCVAVILFDIVARRGGMTHIFQCVDRGPMGAAAVVAEIEKLVNAFMNAGSPRVALEARLVGGAQTLGRGRDVGGEISTACLSFLRAERIPIACKDIGGARARRITFAPVAGVLRITFPGSDLPDVLPPAVRPGGGETELF